MGKENMGRFAPNGYVDGPPDLRQNSYETETSLKPQTPLNPGAVLERAKKSHVDVFKVLVEIYNKGPAKLGDVLQTHGPIMTANSKRNIDSNAGLVPILDLQKIWQEVKDEKITQEDASLQLNGLWARYQLPKGICTIPLAQGGDYPSLEARRAEYRERTRCDPDSGIPIQDQIQSVQPPQPQYSPQAQFIPQPSFKPQNFPSQPPQAFPQAQPVQQPRTSNDIAMTDADDPSASSVVPINPHRRQGMSFLIKPNPAAGQGTILRPGYTDTGDRIVAYSEQRCSRVYVVERNSAYLLQSEGLSGGKRVWTNLPENIKRERKIGYIWGRWVAVSTCKQLCLGQLPMIACEFYWEEEAGVKKTAILWRSQLKEIMDAKYGDRLVTRMMAPAGSEPNDIWEALQCYQPSIRHVRREQRLLLPSIESDKRADMMNEKIDRLTKELRVMMIGSQDQKQKIIDSWNPLPNIHRPGYTSRPGETTINLEKMEQNDPSDSEGEL